MSASPVPAVADQVPAVADQRPLGTPPEVAAYVNVPVKTLYQWRYAGGGPRAIRVGRHLRYRWADVEEWLEDRAAAP
jgi:excisionase family DNA binding protein